MRSEPLDVDIPVVIIVVDICDLHHLDLGSVLILLGTHHESDGATRNVEQCRGFDGFPQLFGELKKKLEVKFIFGS